uniref:Uncharacterized protein n=1 Tax=Sphaerodactylus townsendi TaxID=933632 RepID=A0ACB8GB28_9SAUR
MPAQFHPLRAMGWLATSAFALHKQGSPLYGREQGKHAMQSSAVPCAVPGLPPRSELGCLIISLCNNSGCILQQWPCSCVIVNTYVLYIYIHASICKENPMCVHFTNETREQYLDKCTV